MPPSMLETLLGHVENGYMNHNNPYHNNLHACDVLQTTHYFISQTGLAVSIIRTPPATSYDPFAAVAQFGLAKLRQITVASFDYLP